MTLEIEIFTSKDCAFCPRAKEVLEKVVSEFPDVVIKEVDVESDRGKEEAENLGVLTTPVIIISKDMRFTGVPREEHLREAIQKEIELFENEEGTEE